MGCEHGCGGHKWCNPWSKCGHRWVDGVGGEVNDASGADKMGGQFLHVLGHRGLNYGMWGQ